MLTAQSPAGPSSEKKINFVRVYQPFPVFTNLSVTAPQGSCLLQNYPNPFSMKSIIKYTLPSYTHVKLIIFDALGRQVQILTDEDQNSGAYSVTMNAKNLPAGVYYYQLKTGNGDNLTRKMIVRH